jgi:hypothetical protein
MIATLLAAAALGAAPPHAHPCRTPLPHGPAVPSPIVLWTSCGSFQLAPDGRVSRLPRHWLAKQGSGTGRRYGAHLDIRRSHSGRFLRLLRGRVVWRSSGLYPGDGGGVAFGPHSFAFASYRRGVFLTDLHGAERLVTRGRGLYPYSFTSSGDLFVSGARAITLLSPAGVMLRRFRYRVQNGYGFDEQTDTLYYVTPTGRLAAAHGTHVELKRTLPHTDGMLSVARPNLLVFSGSHSITATSRDGTVIAKAHWSSSHLNSDAGVSVSADRRSFAFRLSDAHPAHARAPQPSIYSAPAPARRSRSTIITSGQAVAPSARASAGTARACSTAPATARSPSSTPAYERRPASSRWRRHSRTVRSRSARPPTGAATSAHDAPRVLRAAARPRRVRGPLRRAGDAMSTPAA